MADFAGNATALAPLFDGLEGALWPGADSAPLFDFTGATTATFDDFALAPFAGFTAFEGAADSAPIFADFSGFAGVAPLLDAFDSAVDFTFDRGEAVAPLFDDFAFDAGLLVPLFDDFAAEDSAPPFAVFAELPLAFDFAGAICAGSARANFGFPFDGFAPPFDNFSFATGSTLAAFGFPLDFAIAPVAGGRCFAGSVFGAFLAGAFFSAFVSFFLLVFFGGAFFEVAMSAVVT